MQARDRREQGVCGRGCVRYRTQPASTIIQLAYGCTPHLWLCELKVQASSPTSSSCTWPCIGLASSSVPGSGSASRAQP